MVTLAQAETAARHCVVAVALHMVLVRSDEISLALGAEVHDVRHAVHCRAPAELSVTREILRVCGQTEDRIDAGNCAVWPAPYG